MEIKPGHVSSVWNQLNDVERENTEEQGRRNSRIDGKERLMVFVDTVNGVW